MLECRVLSEPYSLTSVHGLYTQKRIKKEANLVFDSIAVVMTCKSHFNEKRIISYLSIKKDSKLVCMCVSIFYCALNCNAFKLL